MSPKDLDDIEYQDALNIWEMYQRGMIGPTSQYITAYNNYAMLNKISETLIAVNSKNYKPKPPEEFRNIFMEQFKLLSLNESDRNKLSLGSQAAIGLMDANAPKWLRKAVQQEIESNGSTNNNN